MAWKKRAFTNGRFPLMGIALFVFMGISCAKQGLPPGGSVDEIPPELVSSTPVLNATNVSVSEPLVFEFSELMDEESVEENLFIVPIPTIWPVFEWHARGRILVVRLAQPLDDNTTYVVSIGSKARDRRRNGLKDSIMLSFSTGEVLEDKKIKGNVIPYHFFDEQPEKVSEVDVISYRLDDSSDDPDPRNDVPDYFTQTGSDGSYEMVGLSRGLYRIFAIGDKDKDGFYTENYDMIGLMSHDLTISESDSVVTASAISISQRYTSEVQLSSVRAVDNQRIIMYFDKDIEPESIQIEIEGLSIPGWFSDNGNPRNISVATEVQENRKRYIFKNIDVTDIDGNKLMSFDIQPFFDGTDRPDTSALEIVEWGPKILSSLDERINLVFNRILDFPQGIEGIIREDSGEELKVNQTAPNELEVVPVKGWQNNFNYIILFDRESLRGIAGNELTVEGAQILFNVVPSDTLGSIEGILEDYSGNPEASYRLIFKNIDAGTVKELVVDSTGEWTTGPVLPGRYLFMAHKDDDKDGEISRGSVYPYSAAEQVTAYPDTIAVEPRWPVEDINIVFR